MSPAKRSMWMTSRQSARMLEVWPVCSPHAHARILRRDATAARAMPGIAAVLLAEDVPGLNDVGAVRHDEILLADKEAFYHGQIIALVVGESQEACRAAAARSLSSTNRCLPFSRSRKRSQPTVSTANRTSSGAAMSTAALNDSPLTLDGEFSFGGQDHFYLETNAAWAERGEDGTIFISSSTQHPSEVQHIVAHVLALADAQRGGANVRAWAADSAARKRRPPRSLRWPRWPRPRPAARCAFASIAIRT